MRAWSSALDRRQQQQQQPWREEERGKGADLKGKPQYGKGSSGFDPAYYLWIVAVPCMDISGKHLC